MTSPLLDSSGPRQPSDEPHLEEIARCCKRVYTENDISGGAFDVETRFDVVGDSADKDLIVTFCGSESWRDWTVNSCLTMVKYADDCHVHAGFLSAWSSVDLQVVDRIDQLMRNHKQVRRIVVAGHSLGSAMATLCAFDLIRVRPQYDVRLTTFAGPRVGDKVFADKVCQTLRPLTLCHRGDMVPAIPRFSLVARRWFHPCGQVFMAAPKRCWNLVDRHLMHAYCETVDAMADTPDPAEQ